MAGIGYLWAWIIAAILMMDQNARTAFAAAGIRAWNAAKATAFYSLMVLRGMLWATAILLIIGAILAIIGLFLSPAFTLAAIALLMLWCGLLWGAVVAIGGVIDNLMQGVPKIPATASTPEIDIGQVGKSMAGALMSPKKPLVIIIVILACFGIIVLIFPGIGNVVGIAIILLIILGVARGAYLGRPIKLRLVPFLILLTIAALITRFLFPTIGRVQDPWRRNSAEIVTSWVIRGEEWEYRQTLKNMPLRKFSAEAYPFGAPPFLLPGSGNRLKPAEVTVKLATIKGHDYIVVVVKLNYGPPNSVKADFGKQMLWSLIQIGEDAKGRYIVPRICVDPEERDRFQAMKKQLQITESLTGLEADKKEIGVAERKLVLYSKTRALEVLTDEAWFWPYDAEKDSAEEMVFPQKGSVWVIIKKVEPEKLPDKISEFLKPLITDEAKKQMVFYQVYDRKKPSELFIAQEDMINAKEIDPFEASREAQERALRREEEVRRLAAMKPEYFRDPDGVRIILGKTQEPPPPGAGKGFWLHPGDFCGSHYSKPVAAGTTFVLSPRRALSENWIACIFTGAGGREGRIVEYLNVIDEEYSAQHSGWVGIFTQDFTTYKNDLTQKVWVRFIEK